MKSLLIVLFLCAHVAVAATAPGSRALDAAPRPPGFSSVRPEYVPTYADVLPSSVAECKGGAPGHVIASAETLSSDWKLRLLRYQEWNSTLGAWVDFERDSSIYDVNGRLAIVSARHTVLGVWENYYRFFYSYDGNGNLVQFLSQSWYEGAWLNYVKYEYTYDASDHQLSFTHIKWFSGNWQNVRRFTHVYDGLGNEVQYLFELWDDPTWLSVNRSSYDYDGESRRVNTILQTWDGTKWLNTQHDSTSYNAAGLPETMTTQMWEPTGKVWVDYSAVVLAYNAYGDETSRLNRLWVSFAWFDSSRTLSQYEPQGHVIVVTRQLNREGQWVDDAHDVTVYDPYWNVSSFYTQSWTGSSWLNTIRYLYGYDPRQNRVTELSQRWNGNDWADKTYIEKEYDEVHNLLSEMRQSWTGYGWLNVSKYVYGYEGPKQLFDVRGKWNIVSVPLTMSDYTKTVVFPTAISEAFAFSQGYSATTTLQHGRGYWLKFTADQWVTFEGVSRHVDTIDVVEGWNMVGALTTDLPVANIGSIPDSIVTGEFYGYGNGYQASEFLEPARGYWVKISQPGKLILDAASTNPPANRIRIHATGELPPPPPEESALVSGLPTRYELFQNYPNPFNPSTTVSYALPLSGEVELRVYDILGRPVALLASGRQEAGVHAVRWEARDLPSGIYVYRLAAGPYTASRKLLLMK